MEKLIGFIILFALWLGLLVLAITHTGCAHVRREVWACHTDTECMEECIARYGAEEDCYP